MDRLWKASKWSAFRDRLYWPEETYTFLCPFDLEFATDTWMWQLKVNGFEASLERLCK